MQHPRLRVFAIVLSSLLALAPLVGCAASEEPEVETSDELVVGRMTVRPGAGYAEWSDGTSRARLQYEGYFVRWTYFGGGSLARIREADIVFRARCAGDTADRRATKHARLPAVNTTMTAACPPDRDIEWATVGIYSSVISECHLDPVDCNRTQYSTNLTLR